MGHIRTRGALGVAPSVEMVLGELAALNAAKGCVSAARNPERRTLFSGSPWLHLERRSVRGLEKGHFPAY